MTDDYIGTAIGTAIGVGIGLGTLKMVDNAFKPKRRRRKSKRR